MSKIEPVAIAEAMFKETKIQQAVKKERERIFKELGKYGIWFEHYDRRNEYQGNFIRISEAVFQALREGKL